MQYRVHNTQNHLSQEALSYLENNGCKVSHGSWDNLDEEEICCLIKGVDAVIAGGEPYTGRVFAAAGRLKIVARSGVGFDRIDLNAAGEHGVWVTITPGLRGNAPAVSDLTLGLILSLLRNIHGMAHDMKRGKWEQYKGRELGSLVLGIVGTGSIGREVIMRARGFGAKILAYDIQPDEDFAHKWQIEYVALDELMNHSDLVSLHVSLSENTEGLIDGSRLRLMKNTAYLINTSLAAVVDRPALLEMLQDQRIAGAALDVHDPAPCAPDDPLVLQDNVLATPFVAAKTAESIARMSITAAREVVTVLKGSPPNFPVNPLDPPL